MGKIREAWEGIRVARKDKGNMGKIRVEWEGIR
jgi:hypothetical protein